MFIITMSPVSFCYGLARKSSLPVLDVLDKDSNAFAFEFGFEKFVDLRVDDYVIRHFVIALYLYTMTYVYCGLLDHLYCDRSVICRLSGEDTELNQFLKIFEVGVL